jgi:hypothetical protein
MSDPNNKTLSDLLIAARNEPEQEFVSTRDAERLVANSPMRDVPSTWQRLHRPLLSTPLRLSITAMTSAAVITLATLGIRALLPGAASQVTQSPQLAQAQHQQPHNNIVAVDTNLNRIQMIAPSIIKTEVAREVPPPASISVSPEVPVTPDIPTVKPIELDEQQLSQIGVMLKNNGDIDFFTQFKKDSSLSHYGLPPNAGMKIHFSWDGPHKVGDLPGFQVPASAPKLITSISGSKRLFSLETSSYSDGAHEIHTETIKNFTDSTGHMDVGPVFDDDTLFQDMIGKRLKGVNHGSIVIRDEIKEVDSSNGTPRQIKIVKRIELNNHVPNKGEEDSIFAHVARMALDSFRMHNDQHTFEPMAHNIDSVFKVFSNNPLAFDQLIPIRVVNNKNPEHPNELIFWYEPSPEITNLLPAQKQSGTVRMAPKFSVQVYPNPTSGPAQITYTMKDAAHHADFVIRNLLGQKVMDAGSSDGTSGNISLDLSKLEAGLYLLVTTTDDGEQSVERIVVNK